MDVCVHWAIWPTNFLEKGRHFKKKRKKKKTDDHNTIKFHPLRSTVRECVLPPTEPVGKLNSRWSHLREKKHVFHQGRSPQFSNRGSRKQLLPPLEELFVFQGRSLAGRHTYITAGAASTPSVPVCSATSVLAGLDLVRSCDLLNPAAIEGNSSRWWQPKHTLSF